MENGPVDTRAETGTRGRFLTALGTTLEWYDFTLFVYLAPVIGTLFFPAGDKLDSLLSAFGVFAVGYLMRPVGAIFFGQLGDRRGRKTALIVSVGLMTIPMIVIALLPTSASIGVAAPLILVLMRLVQGFSVGGEFSGTLVLMNESAKDDRRGFMAGIAQSATGLGMLLASGIAALLSALLTTDEMAAFGWRIPFFIGAGIGIVALLMRIGMSETPAFLAVRESGTREAHPARKTLRHHSGDLLKVFGMTGFAGIAGYMVATWLPSFLQTVIGAGAAEALLATTLGAALHIVLCPLAGRVADRSGRKPVMVGAAVAIAVLAYPLFVLVASTEFWRIVAGTLGLMALSSWYLGGFSATVAELFPTETRFSGVSIGYNLATAVFSGTTPLLATALVKWTGWNLAPSIYLIAAALGVLILLTRVPETINVDLRRTAPATSG
jgi:MHS family proline/betaine transporter-like MFS transporter